MFDVFVERMFTGVSFLVGEITTILGFQNLFETVLPHETTLGQSNIAMENGPFEDTFPIQNGDFPLLC